MPLPESHAAYEEEDTCHMSYEEEDTCHCQRAMLHPQTCTDSQKSAYIVTFSSKQTRSLTFREGVMNHMPREFVIHINV